MEHLAADLFGGKILTSISLIPDEYSLNNAYPNPFNPATTISYGVPYDSFIKLTIYDMMGREVAILFNDIKPAGYHEIIWNADNHSSGMYFVQMVSSEYLKTQKLMLVK